jgi:hypothetical protein
MAPLVVIGFTRFGVIPVACVARIISQNGNVIFVPTPHKEKHMYKT